MDYKKVPTEIDLLIVALQWSITIVDQILNISFQNRAFGIITTVAFSQLKVGRDIDPAKV